MLDGCTPRTRPLQRLRRWPTTPMCGSPHAGARRKRPRGRQPWPISLALNQLHRPDLARRRAPNHAPGAPRMTTGLAEKHQETPAPRFTANSRQLVARAWLKRSSHPGYQKENELGAVRITLQMSRVPRRHEGTRYPARRLHLRVRQLIETHDPTCRSRDL